MYYKVTLINNTEDKSYAYIAVTKDSSSYYVVSNNAKLKEALDLILQEDVYILSPGANRQGYSSDGVTFLQAGSMYYFAALPEILGWRGYRAVFKDTKGVRKSMNHIPEFYSAGEYIYALKNADLDNYIRMGGEGGSQRIVVRVPPGYVAVHQDGRIRRAGKFLNANIDKENPEWSLYEDTDLYEDLDEEELYDMLSMVGEGGEYHPAMEYDSMESYEDEDGEENDGILDEDKLEALYGSDFGRVERGDSRLDKFISRESTIPSVPLDADSQEQHMPEEAVFEGEEIGGEGNDSVGDLDEDTSAQDMADELASMEGLNEAIPQHFNLPDFPAVLFSPDLNIAIDKDAFMDNIDAMEEVDTHFYEKRWWAIPYANGRVPTDADVQMRNPKNLLTVDPRDIAGVRDGMVRTQHASNHLAEEWAGLVAYSDWELSSERQGYQVSGNIYLNPRESSRTYSTLPEHNEAAYRLPEEASKRAQARANLNAITASMSSRDEYTDELRFDREKASKIKVDGLYLEGEQAPSDAILFKGNFNGREYQLGMIAAATDMSQFEKYGGPKHHHGHMFNASYGIGKTASLCATWSVMWNRGLVERGKQTMVISAPRIQTEVWGAEYKKFLSRDDVVVISGSREQREQQWQDIARMAQEGNMPSAVVLASSAFSKARKGSDEYYYDNPDDSSDVSSVEQGAANSMDATYLQLLARGGNLNGEEVAGGHIAVMAIDESGQYANRTAARHAVLTEVIDDVVDNGGLTYTLSGDLSGNGVADTVSEMSLINSYVRDNYMDLIHKYTQTFDGKSAPINPRDRAMNRLKWKSKAAGMEFMREYGTNVHKTSGEWVAGDSHGLFYTADIIADMGEFWGGVYSRSLKTAARMMTSPDPDIRQRGLGMQTILDNAGIGGVGIARLFEYGFGSDRIIEELRKVRDDSGELMLKESDISVIKARISEYIATHTVPINLVADREEGDTADSLTMQRVPRAQADGGISADARDKEFAAIVATGRLDGDAETAENNYMAALNEVLFNFDTPALDTIVEGMVGEIKANRGANENIKLGVGQFSTQAIRKLARLIKDHPDLEGVMLNVVDGTTSAQEVSRIQEAHNNEKVKNVITMVSSAGKYGLSLAAKRSWRTPAWNPSVGSQLTGRFHRDPKQEHIATIVATGGLLKYKQYVAQFKESIEAQTISAMGVDSRYLEDNDDGLPMITDVGEFKKFLDALLSAEFTPNILKKEMRNAAEEERRALIEERARVREESMRPVDEEKAARADRARRRGTTKSAWGRVLVPRKVYNKPTLTKNPLGKKD